jgi:2-polyprenyl-6-methoxyphenol hydroxylase-like FAD-dependent oxidoreductase
LPEATKTSVIIAGAGIGGMTAAAALTHKGVDAVVLERAPTLDHIRVGGGIHLWPNGQQALAYIDGRDKRLREELDPDAHLKHASFDTWRGSRMFQWDTHDTLCVTRGALHRALSDAVPEGVVRTDAAVAKYEEHGDGVSVTLASGEAIEADALVGADGAQSTVRAQLLGDGRPRYAGYTTWIGVVEFEHPNAPPGLFRILFGHGARFLYFPIGGGKLYWEASVGLPEGGRDPAGGHRETLLSHFSQFAEPTVPLISATDDEAIVRGDIYDRPPAPSWGSGRVTLLGDAAHPMTNALGQGANQAMEDAVVLADSLALGAEVTAALQEYQRRRIPRASKIQKLSHRLAGVHMWRRRPAVWSRTAFLRTLGPFVINAMRKDVSGDFLAD